MFLGVCESLGLLWAFGRSSEHGRGMNRFWTHVQAYKGPIVLLISAKVLGDSLATPFAGTWVIGAFVPDGLDNRESFYGSSGCCLYCISPDFRPIRASGIVASFQLVLMFLCFQEKN